MRPGDTLVITKPDRVAHSVKGLLVLLEDELAPRGINLHCHNAEHEDMGMMANLEIV